MRKLQAFAALGFVLAAAAFYFGWFFAVMTPVTPATAGLDRGSSDVSRIAVGIIFTALIAVGLAFFRQLWHGVKTGR